MTPPDKDELRRYKRSAERIYHFAQIVADKLTLTGGGDHYRFEGSMNDVEDLRDALEAYRYRDLERPASDSAG